MRFNGICLASQNVRRLRDFYVAVLQSAANDSDWWVEFEDLPGFSFTIYSAEGMQEMAPGSMQGAGSGSFTIELEVEDIETEFERIRQLGAEVVKPLTTQTWGRRSAWFRDPDGNIVNIYKEVPAS